MTIPCLPPGFRAQPTLATPPGGTRAAFAAAVLLALGLTAGPARAIAEDAPGSVSAAGATGSGRLETSIDVQKLDVREGPGGQEIRAWVPAERLNAGDEVHYTVRVRNPGKQAVDTVVVTKRLPFGVRYLRGSATGPAAVVQFSIDGGKTFATPDALARAAGGSKGQRKPLENEYTHVRWILGKPLGPASTALLRFRATFS
jgi:uncharacterized repeat protein (TIGR01451 family)